MFDRLFGLGRPKVGAPGSKRARREAPLRGPKGGRYLCRGKRVVPGSSPPKSDRRVVARRWGFDYRRTFRTRRAALEYGRSEGREGMPVLLPIKRAEFD